MAYPDESTIKAEIDDISKRIQSIVETLKEFEPDQEANEEPKEES